MHNLRKVLFIVYFYLFFFVMFNREFTPFGMDFRIIVGFLGVILLLLGIKDIILRKKILKVKTIDYCIIVFFCLSFLSNIVWLFNGLEMQKHQFTIIFISYGFNFLSYLVFRLYQKYISVSHLKYAVLFSIFALFYSILIAYMEIDIQKYIMSGCQGFVKDLSPNFLGGIYRYSGYAEDPNYASLFFVLASATYIYCQKLQNKKINYAYLLLFFLGILLSASKTIMVAIMPAICFILLKNCKFTGFLKKIWIPVIIFIPILFILSDFKLFHSMITMNQRFHMWEYALDLFKQSPIIGNGFTAFRSYAVTVNWWYVQCHSTIFQMLSETGAISLLLFAIILTKNLLINNKYLTFVTVLFSIYMITTETAYHVYFIFILAILPIVVKECELWKKQSSSS